MIPYLAAGSGDDHSPGPHRHSTDSIANSLVSTRTVFANPRVSSAAKTLMASTTGAMQRPFLSPPSDEPPSPRGAAMSSPPSIEKTLDQWNDRSAISEKIQRIG